MGRDTPPTPYPYYFGVPVVLITSFNLVGDLRSYDLPCPPSYSVLKTHAASSSSTIYSAACVISSYRACSKPLTSAPSHHGFASVLLPQVGIARVVTLVHFLFSSLTSYTARSMIRLTYSYRLSPSLYDGSTSPSPLAQQAHHRAPDLLVGCHS